MSKRQLSAAEQRIWELHMAGHEITSISKLTGQSEAFVRATVAGVWRDEAVKPDD